ncbi:MAG TPA: hypothetical protein VFB38_18945 [Chthonomonadaceae bacterium]|nr:hypothetical protein [Chthonomonadaceae bacterium]
MPPLRRALPLLLGAATLLTVVLLGCGSGSGQSGSTPHDQQSRVRFFNGFIPQAGQSSTLSVTNQGAAMTGPVGISFAEFLPTHTYLSVGRSAFQPMATGAGLAGPVPAQAPIHLDGAPTAYTLALVGQAGQSGDLKPQILVIPDLPQVMAFIPDFQMALRVINLSPGLGPITLLNEQEVLNSNMTNIPYGYDPALNPYILVPTRPQLHLSLRDASHPSQDLPVAGNWTSPNLLNGHTYTLYVYGQRGNAAQPLSATIVEDAVP